MKPLFILIFAVTFYSNGFARDTKHMLSISEAMNSTDFQSRLDKNIKLYFGDQDYGKASKTMNTFVTNKKTNAFNKSDEEACRWVFLSALLELQERARKEGANAVVNIESYHKKNVHRSSETYECHAGALIAGVALRGTLVKL
jgi:uncharacterized protein YbjQ (UPF0145 family)